jgi:hypothetical protein
LTHGIHAITTRAPANGSLVDITRATSNIEDLAGVILLINSHYSIQHEHALLTNLVEFGLERIVWDRTKSRKRRSPVAESKC